VDFFPLDPGGYRYRPLKKGVQGWDVYALQTALPAIARDGVFGSLTDGAVVDFQQRHRLTDDGIAGVITQREVALQRLWPVQDAEKTPPGLMRGQVEAESSFWVGNHSPRYLNGNYDLGIVQQNVDLSDAPQAYDVVGGLQKLGRQLRQKHDKYVAEGLEDRQAWELAAGSWNAPAWADKLAAGGTLTQAQKDQLEAYIARVTVYYT
jgi:hypothetical protein